MQRPARPGTCGAAPALTYVGAMTETEAATVPPDGFTHRQAVYRLLPRRRGVWRRLERLLEAQRQL